jgi:hypothetical protein
MSQPTVAARLAARSGTSRVCTVLVVINKTPVATNTGAVSIAATITTAAIANATMIRVDVLTLSSC